MHFESVARYMVASALVFAFSSISLYAAVDEYIVLPESNTTLTVLHNGETYCDVELVGWGPNWSWMGLPGSLQEQADSTRMVSRGKVAASNAEIDVTVSVRKTGPRQMTLDFEFRSSRDTTLTYIVAAVSMAGSAFRDGQVMASLADGSSRTTQLPLDRKGIGENVAGFDLVDATGAKTQWTLSPAQTFRQTVRPESYWPMRGCRPRRR